MAPTFETLTRPGCTLCPRACKVSRHEGETGYCLAGPLPHVSQAGAHHGEEPPLSGRYGSGTIFLSGCNLHCVFCQNYDISSALTGQMMDAGDLADAALSLESMGCHNVNFVTPTHHADVLAEAIRRARARGLAVPCVYNCGGYESPETLRLLDGLVEIYMPDVKFFDPEACRRYLNAEDYGQVVREALEIMQAQVGDLEIRSGLAVRGLLVRHLVMPGFTRDALEIMSFIHNEISERAFVNVMQQYWPTSGVEDRPEIRRGVNRDEVDTVKRHAQDLGLRLCRD